MKTNLTHQFKIQKFCPMGKWDPGEFHLQRISVENDLIETIATTSGEIKIPRLNLIGILYGNRNIFYQGPIENDPGVPLAVRKSYEWIIEVANMYSKAEGLSIDDKYQGHF